MAKENYVAALDNLLKVYMKDRQWLSILCDLDYQELDKALASKRLTYGMLQSILQRGGITMAITIKGEQQPFETDKRMQFLKDNIRLHQNGQDMLVKATGNNRAPDIWWERDDIAMKELCDFEKAFHITLNFTFTGISNQKDITTNKPTKSVNWKTLSTETVERFRENAKKIFLNETDKSVTKKLMSQAVLVNYDPVKEGLWKKAEKEASDEPETKVEETPAESEFFKESEKQLLNVIDNSMEEETAAEEKEETPEIEVQPTIKKKKEGPSYVETKLTVKFQDVKEIHLLNQIAKIKGIQRGKMLYETIVNNLLYNKKEEPEKSDQQPPVETPTTKKAILTFQQWLDKIPGKYKSAYLNLLHRCGDPWVPEETPLGKYTILAVDVFREEEKDLVNMAYLFERDISIGKVTASPKRDASIKEQFIIHLNKETLTKSELYTSIIKHLSASGKNQILHLKNPIPLEGGKQKYIDTISYISKDGKEDILIKGYEKTFLGKRELKQENIDDIHRVLPIESWYKMAMAAEEHYNEYGRQRPKKAVQMATDIMKSSYDQLNSTITEIKENFRLIVAELVSVGRNEDFIQETDSRIYSKPAIKDGRAGIEVTTDSEDRWWSEDELALPVLLELAEAMRKHIA